MAYSAPSSKTPSPMALAPEVPSNALAADIGGSLVKLVLWERAGPAAPLPPWVRRDTAFGDRLPLTPPPAADSSEEQQQQHHHHRRVVRFSVQAPHCFTGVLRFLRFPESAVPQFVAWVRAHALVDVYLGARAVHATGGGCYQYAELVQRELGVRLLPQDEFRCAVKGLNFLLRHSASEVFTYEQRRPSFYSSSRWAAERVGLFPYLLVCMGSGVSVLRVSAPDEFERVSGTALGGGSFWGLCKLLTGCSNFEDLMALVGAGDSTRTDLLVGDIYGSGAYGSIGLAADVTASFFGKLQRTAHAAQECSSADVAKSLLNMVTMNVAHIAFLNATLHGIHTIFFSGSFLRGHPPIWELLSNAIAFWSKGSIKAMFLLHDGYLGALGALLEPIDQESFTLA